MKRLTAVLAAAIVAATSVAAAQGQQQRQDGAAERQVCRTVSTTGTILRSRRECRTAAEWRLLERGARDSLNGVGPRDPTMKAR